MAQANGWMAALLKTTPGKENLVKWTIEKVSQTNLIMDVKNISLFGHDFDIAFTKNSESFGFQVSTQNFVFKCKMTLLDINGCILCKDFVNSVETADRSVCMLFVPTNENYVYPKLDDLPQDILVVLLGFGFVEKPKTHRYNFFHKKYLRELSSKLENLPTISQLEEQVTLCVGVKTVNVNKAILCCQSPVFKELLQMQNNESLNVVVIDDMSMPILTHLIAFLYSGIVREMDFNSLCELYTVAQSYSLLELRSALIDLIIFRMNVHNACLVLKIADQHADRPLKKAAKNFLSAHLEIVITTDQWCTLVLNETKLALEVMKLSIE